MAIMGTLAKLEEYFKGWHTKYYELLHKGLPPQNHANVKATKTVLGHVTLTDDVTDKCEDGVALCPASLFNSEQKLQNSINDNKNKINELEKYLYNLQPVQLKIGKVWPISDGNLYSLVVDGTLDSLMSEPNEYFSPRVGAWGASKVHVDGAMDKNANKERIAVKVLGTDGTPKEKVNIWININGKWYPRTTNRLGYGFVNMDLHQVAKSFYDENGNKKTGEDLNNAIRSAAFSTGDIWQVMEVIGNVDNDNNSWFGVNNTIHKRFFVNYGQNLWNKAMRDGLFYQPSTKIYYVNPTRSSNPDFAECKIYYDEPGYRKDEPIGYHICDATDQDNKIYYRYPRTKYPYGHRLSTDMNNEPIR